MEEKFQALLSVIDTNNSFQIKVNEDKNTFQNNKDIRLIINNNSRHSIIFNPESYIKLWTIRNEEWIEIENGITYSGTLQVLPQGTLLLDTRTSRVKPVLSNDAIESNEKILLRIAMIGEIMENDKPTGKLVGSYIDVYIIP